MVCSLAINHPGADSFEMSLQSRSTKLSTAHTSQWVCGKQHLKNRLSTGH